MIKIILMLPHALMGNMIADILGFGRIVQITCGAICATIALILIDML